MDDRGAAAPTLIAILGGALLAGAVVGGILGATGAVSLVGEPAVVADQARASYRDCPDGAVLGGLTRGDRVLITGRDAGGEWAEIRSPVSADSRVWIRATQVLPDGDTTGLPVMQCRTPGGTIAVQAITTTTTTEVTDTTTADTTPSTTSTTEATGTTGTTQPADTTAPVISNAAVSPSPIWELDGGVFGITCPASNPRAANISANVTDDVGVTSVNASWSDPSGGGNVALAASGNTYSTSFGNYPADTWDSNHVSPYDHPVTITITARDAAGNQRQTTVQAIVIEAGQCFG
jgi:hypothetical protein